VIYFSVFDCIKVLLLATGQLWTSRRAKSFYLFFNTFSIIIVLVHLIIEINQVSPHHSELFLTSYGSSISASNGPSGSSAISRVLDSSIGGAVCIWSLLLPQVAYKVNIT
jgi:hypothetical protein